MKLDKLNYISYNDKMILNNKYRLYPDKKQESKLDQQFFISNQSWNYALNIRIKNLRNKNGFTPTKLIEKYIKTKLIVRNLKGNTGFDKITVEKLEIKKIKE